MPTQTRSSALANTDPVCDTGRNRESANRDTNNMQTNVHSSAGVEESTTPQRPPRRSDVSPGGGALPADFQSLAGYISEKFTAFANLLAAHKTDVCSKLSDLESRLASRITALEIDNENLKTALKKRESEQEVLVARLNNCERKLQLAERAEVENEQYSRKSSIRIYGLPSAAPNEDAKRVVCDFVNNRLKIQPPLDHDAIDVAHRVGAKTPHNTQTMLCKFIKRTDKIRVIKARSTLKGTRLSITDDIAKRNIEYMEELKKKSRNRPDLVLEWQNIL